MARKQGATILPPDISLEAAFKQVSTQAQHADRDAVHSAGDVPQRPMQQVRAKHGDTRRANEARDGTLDGFLRGDVAEPCAAVRGAHEEGGDVGAGGGEPGPEDEKGADGDGGLEAECGRPELCDGVRDDVISGGARVLVQADPKAGQITRIEQAHKGGTDVCNSGNPSSAEEQINTNKGAADGEEHIREKGGKGAG